MTSRYRTNLKAFTLTDVLMSLFVMAVIISTIFLVMNLLYKQLLDYKNFNEPVTEFNRLSYLINKDIFESERLEKTTKGLFFHFSDKPPVIWKDDSANLYAIREDVETKDTFRIPVRVMKLDTIRSFSEEHLYQRVTCGINLSDDIIEVRFYKRLYPNQLLSSYEY